MSQTKEILSKSTRIQPRTFALICFLICGLQALAASHRLTGLEVYLKGQGYEVVPFRENARHEPLVSCESSGKKFRFLADTGWSITTLDAHTARGLKTLRQRGLVLQDSVLGTLTNSSLVLIDKLTIGRAEFMNQPAKVQSIKLDYIRTHFDGVLGVDFFRRNFCLLDCKAGKLYLHGSKPSEEACEALEKSLRQSGFVEVPLDLKAIPTAHHGKVNGQEVRFIIDTGSLASFLDEKLAKQLELKPRKYEGTEVGTFIPEDATARVVGVGKGGLHRAWITTLSTFEMGTVQWKEVTFGVQDLSTWGLGKKGNVLSDVQGIFGNDWLEHYGVIIDFPNARLWFVPPQNL